MLFGTICCSILETAVHLGKWPALGFHAYFFHTCLSVFVCAFRGSAHLRCCRRNNETPLLPERLVLIFSSLFVTTLGYVTLSGLWTPTGGNSEFMKVLVGKSTANRGLVWIEFRLNQSAAAFHPACKCVPG